MVFTRFPEAGAVKTRLIPALGAEGALWVHKLLTTRALAAARQWGGFSGGAVQVWVAGDDGARMKPLFGEFDYMRQPEGDLGDRMRHAFDCAFSRGYAKAAIVGSDLPLICPQDITDAFAGLDSADVALGPALDGGYWLVALKRPTPSLFRDIPWSSASVCATTREHAAAAGLTVSLLRTLRDVDTPEDLVHFPDLQP
jgi:rSAM/selenodomain-associated transferase 1